MMNFTLSKAQEDFRDYAHQVAVEEMRPISLECDRSEKIPESFFWNMQRRLSPEALAPIQAELASETGQNYLLSMLSNEEMAWGDTGLSSALPGPGLGVDGLCERRSAR